MANVKVFADKETRQAKNYMPPILSIKPQVWVGVNFVSNSCCLMRLNGPLTCRMITNGKDFDSSQLEGWWLWKMTRDDHLTHYQTTNFRRFQTERVCRRQFQIWRKWQKVIQMGRKHCGKWRNCSLRAISPFPTVFSKGMFFRGVERCHCVEMS